MDINKQLAATLTLSIALGVSSFAIPFAHPTSVYADTMTATSSSLTQDQQAALNHLNDIRQHMGLLPVTVNPILTQSATAHANYINTNGGGLNGVQAHDETAGQPGFTGVTPQDRIFAAGGSSFKSNGEVMDVNNSLTLSGSIDDFMQSALHRDALLDPQLQYMGMSAIDGTIVIDLAYYNTAPSIALTQDEAYPYNGQTNVPVDFYGSQETPDPLVGFNTDHTGSIISYDTPKAVVANSVNFKLVDSQGNNAPYYTDEYQGYSTGGHFFPKQPLKYNEKYTASVSYTDIYTGTSYQKSWSFTTMTNSNGGSGSQDNSGDNWTPPSNLGTFNPTPFSHNGTKYYPTKLQYRMQSLAYSSHIIAKDGDSLTSFLPLYYVNEALAPYGFKGTWDGHTWDITTTQGTDIDLSNLPAPKSTNGFTLAIAINGNVVQYAPRQVAGDPSNGYQATTYLPIWYITQVLKRLGITAAWDGTTWNLL